MTSPSNSKPTTSRTVIPVVLGGGRNLDQWPLSRIEMPVQFQHGRHQKSRFQHALAAARPLTKDHPPIVIMPACALKVAEEQFKSVFGEHGAMRVVEPVDRGTLHATMLATVLANAINREAILIFVDPASGELDAGAISRVVSQTLEDGVAQNRIVACGQPVDDGSGNHLVCVGKGKKTASPALCHAAPHDQQTQRRFALGSMLIGPVQSFITFFEQYHLGDWRRCISSLDRRSEMKGAIWPEIDTYSPLPHAKFANQLKVNACDYLLRPADLLSQSEPAQSGSAYLEDVKNCSVKSDGHLVVLAGCNDLDVVCTADATLVVRKGDRSGFNRALARLQNDERAELFEFPVWHHQWGTRHRIENRENVSICKLIVEPRQSIPSIVESNHSVVWTVISGRGTISTGTATQSVKPSTVIKIHPGQRHGMKNISNSNLIVLESKFGQQSEFEHTDAAGSQSNHEPLLTQQA